MARRSEQTRFRGMVVAAALEKRKRAKCNTCKGSIASRNASLPRSRAKRGYKGPNTRSARGGGSPAGGSATHKREHPRDAGCGPKKEGSTERNGSAARGSAVNRQAAIAPDR